jgi:hypothetical protein
MKIFSARRIAITLFLIVSFLTIKCTKEEASLPKIRLVFEQGYTNDGDTIEVGRPIKFKVEAEGVDANITNFTVKKLFNEMTKTVLDSGLNVPSFSQSFTFYQSIEDVVEWELSVMDRNRNEASASIMVFKDPNSQFGGILEFEYITLGFQENTTVGNFFLPYMNKVFFGDSASLFQNQVDILAYFNYSEDNGVMLPSPTLSSPGEDASCSGALYDEYYPFLCNWDIRNYTKYDIRAINGVTEELYNNCHNDSLLIVSYDNVWGKKKYKWANPGTFIPFQTAAGKLGIIKVLDTNNTETGTITFSLKIQI